MGAYSYFSLGRYTLLDDKHYFDGRLLLIFRQDELIIQLAQAGAQDPYRKCEYRSNCAVVKDRLDLMGFTLDAAIAEFDRGTKDSDPVENFGIYPTEGDMPREGIKHFLEKYTFKKWARTMRRALNSSAIDWNFNRPFLRSTLEFVESGRWGYSGFLTRDPRYFIRACIEMFSADDPVVLDLVGLANAEEFEPDPKLHESLFTQGAVEYARTTQTIILTEGSTDSWILETSLSRIYPHLVGFFSFMDFESARPMGGAGALVNIVKSFSASGIRNRIVAVFDNDTAARSALAQLTKATLSPNIAVCQLPSIASLNHYPGVGPHGLIYSDVNQCAGGIELYLGPSVLGSGRKRIPVRWTGYDVKLRAYQGELVDKSAAHDRYKQLLKRRARNNVSHGKDWADLGTVWHRIKSAAEKLSVDIAASALLI